MLFWSKRKAHEDAHAEAEHENIKKRLDAVEHRQTQQERHLEILQKELEVMSGWKPSST